MIMTCPLIMCMFWSKSPNYPVTSISDLQVTSIITLQMFAAVFMIQIASRTLHTKALPEATLRIANMHSNINMICCCRANSIEKCQRPFLCDNATGKRCENSVGYLTTRKNDTRGTIYGKQSQHIRSENSNPRFMFDYIFKLHAIDVF